MQLGGLDVSGESRCVELTEQLNGDSQKTRKHQGVQGAYHASRRDITKEIRANLRQNIVKHSLRKIR